MGRISNVDSSEDDAIGVVWRGDVIGSTRRTPDPGHGSHHVGHEVA